MIDEILNMLLCFNLMGQYYYFLLEKYFCDTVFTGFEQKLLCSLQQMNEHVKGIWKNLSDVKIIKRFIKYSYF